MAHNIEFNKARGTHSFVSRKEIPWHGLGKIVEEAMTSKEAMELANLDFTVIKVETYAKFPLQDMGTNVMDISGKVYPKNQIPIDAKGALVPRAYATVRTDNKHIFGSVGEMYEVVQNKDAFDFIDNIVGQKLAIYETAGALGDGETTFITAKLPSYIRIDGTDDIITNYMLITNNHSGASPVMAMLTPIRVVCNNTLSMALRSCSNKVVFRHTKNVKDRLDQAMRLMKLSNTYTKDLAEILNQAKTVQITEEIEHKYINSVFLSADEIKLIEAAKGNILGIDEISQRKKNQIIDIRTYMKRGAGQDLHVGTALWLFNGINGYLSNSKNYKDDEKRFDSIMNGESYRINQKAFNNIYDIIVS
jgi:phage/plasmid-like protein (TIGR03299 family)